MVFQVLIIVVYTGYIEKGFFQPEKSRRKDSLDKEVVLLRTTEFLDYPIDYQLFRA